MDIKTKEERSRNMAKIRAKNTKPEMFIRSALHRLNFRYRINYKDIKGHPDLYFTKRKVAIFIHGCYWHRHEDCKFAYIPKTNTDFWNAKFSSNKERDRDVMNSLNSEGIRTLIIWECSVDKMIKDTAMRNYLLSRIVDFILSDNKTLLEL
jgi:DNA mismatch endonuclease, patch repair protein